MKKFLFVCIVVAAALSGCVKPVEPLEKVELRDTVGWCWEDELTENLSEAVATAETDGAFKLHFFGWGEDEDTVFKVQMPAKGNYRKVLLEYTMCGWNQGPADWDMTTEIRVLDKKSGEWYELQRCFTPYGGSFKADWSKVFYMDVTHLLPILLQDGEAEFKIFYCGWDATETKAHAVRLKFYFFEGENEYGGNITSCHKVYDSFISGNNGYRAWAYGVAKAPIEDAERLGLREIQLPAGTKRALLRVCITGHGQEKSTVSDTEDKTYDGYFPGRSSKPKNPAEFDENWYTLKVNGEAWSERGHIWEINKTGVRGNYKQAGTFATARAGWGPGKPANVQYWMINDIPEDGKLTIDLDLDEYVSDREEPNAGYVANYYVMADVFGFDK